MPRLTWLLGRRRRRAAAIRVHTSWSLRKRRTRMPRRTGSALSSSSTLPFSIPRISSSANRSSVDFRAAQMTPWSWADWNRTCSTSIRPLRPRYRNRCRCTSLSTAHDTLGWDRVRFKDLLTIIWLEFVRQGQDRNPALGKHEGRVGNCYCSPTRSFRFLARSICRPIRTENLGREGLNRMRMPFHAANSCRRFTGPHR